MKRQRMNIDKILTDDVLIFAYRRKLWRKYKITPKHKLAEYVVEFLLFLESHNALFDFVDYFKILNTDGYNTIAEYFNDRDPKFYLKGAFYWQFKGHYHVWFGLNELWNEQIKK